MGQKITKLFVFVLAVLLFVSFSQSASAHHKKQVLGESTSTDDLVFPPVTAGPGFLLPDSPLYFLDHLFQSVKVATALSPEQKAKVRMEIAGERMAELRLMLAKEKKTGVDTALSELAKEAHFAAKSLSEAKAQGKDVEKIAREVNEAIKTQRQTLYDLEHQSTGALALQFKSTRGQLKEAKVEVEDHLPGDALAAEIENGLMEDFEDGIGDVDLAISKIERDLVKLEEEVKVASARSLTRREDALKKAIEEKNELLRVEEEKLLAEELVRQESLLKVSQSSIDAAKKAVEEAKSAAEEFKKAKNIVSQFSHIEQVTLGISATSGN